MGEEKGHPEVVFFFQPENTQTSGTTDLDDTAAFE
jgi:hypothetical protein